MAYSNSGKRYISKVQLGFSSAWKNFSILHDKTEQNSSEKRNNKANRVLQGSNKAGSKILYLPQSGN